MRPSIPWHRLWPLASLQRYLTAMVLLAILPLATLACWQIFSDVRARQAEIETGLWRSAAALAEAVQSEQRGSLDALRALAHEDLLADSAVPLRRLLRERPPPRRDWHSVFVLDAQGRFLFDSAGGARGGNAAGELGALHARVLAQAQPAASGLVPVGVPEGQAVLLAVPAGPPGDVRYVVGARVGQAAWQRLAAAAARPAGGYVLVFDDRHRVVGWTLADDVPAGAALSEQAQEATSVQAFGVERLPGVDGRDVYAAWQRVGPTGWGVQVAIPARPIDDARRQAIVAALSTVLASVLLGLALAALAARVVARPLRVLATGGPGALSGRVPVREVARLRDALQAAARQDAAARDALEEDIAHRKRVEAELLAAHLQLQASQQLVELAQDAGRVGFLHYRFSADELAWTPGHCKLFGIDALQPPRLARWFECIAEADRERVERDFWTASAMRRETLTLDYGVPLAGGRPRWLSTRLLLRYGGEGRPVQFTGVTVDLTDHREAEVQRAQLTQQAVAAREAAEAASRAKDELLSMLGHELRNPLGAISAAIDVLQSAPDGEAAAEARAIVARQTHNLAHMMNDLLDVGRVTTGKVLLARQPVNLAAVFDRVQRTVELTRQAARHELRVQSQDAWVDGDAVRLEQVMTNLLTNAIKYTPAGGRIEVSTGVRDGQALFEVADSGVGIPESLLPHVFDLFVQGERTLDRRAGGLGIGLTLVKRLVELHGGTVAAASDPGGGSRFTVRLPAVEAPPRSPAESLPPSRRRRVLVVEDNADMLAALCSKLELDGHAVSTAADGLEGLSRLLRQQPDVSFVDVGLPGLTGFELARHARAAGYGGRMIALSGYGQERDMKEALTAGFDGYLVKPFDREQLRASLSGAG